jgi:hypothetical protein
MTLIEYSCKFCEHVFYWKLLAGWFPQRCPYCCSTEINEGTTRYNAVADQDKKHRLRCVANDFRS